MPRQRRIDYEGAWHHVMNRGRNRESVFRDHDDVLTFLYELEKVVERFSIEVHAYSLMPNHYHLLVRSLHGNLSATMQQLGRDYSQRFNQRHGGDGALFRGRFKSQLVEDGRYLKHLISYIHLNPLRANLVTRIDSDYAWTSHRAYMGLESAPVWLSRNFFLDVFHTPDALSTFALALHTKAAKWPEEMLLTAGWFKRKVGSSAKDNDKSKSNAAEAKTVSAEDLLKDICRATGVSLDRLTQSIAGPGGNPERRFAVWAMRKCSFLTHKQIGDFLLMTPNQVARDLARSRSKIDTFDLWSEKWQQLYPAKVSIGEI